MTHETDDDVVVFRWKRFVVSGLLCVSLLCEVVSVFRIRIFRKLACQILYDMCLEVSLANLGRQ